MATSNKKIFIGLGIGAVLIAAFAYSSPAESKVLVNKPPTPPNKPPKPPLPPARRPGDLGPPAGSGASDAIAAAIAAAQGAAGGGGGGGGGGEGLVPPQAGMLLPNPAPLVQGQRYKARLELSGLQAYGSREQIKSTFEGLGFSNAVVYMTQSELPPASGGTSAWPGLAMANVASGSRWAEGTWNKPSQVVTTPAQIKYAWTA